MTNRSALAFITTPLNKNSVAVLAGVLGMEEIFADLDLLFIRDDANLGLHFDKALREYEQLIVAFSFCTPVSAQIGPMVQRMRASAAEGDCFTTWIAGGPHPSGAPQETLEMGFDLVVVGEAEETLPAVLRRLLEQGSFSDVKGIAYYQEGEFTYTGRAPLVRCLDEFPPFAPQHRRFGPIEIIRGCPYACRFCQTSYLFGGMPRYRSPEVVAAWASIARSYDIPFMRFVAPNALSYGSADGHQTNLAALEDLLVKVGAIMGRDRIYIGSFPSEVRPEMVTDKAIELIKRLAGNKTITLGAQSGSQRMLEAMRRGHSVEDVYRACRIVRRHGLLPNVDVIFGLPGETRRDRELTLRLIEDLTDAGAHVRSHAFIPLAGTPLAYEAPGRIDKETDRLLGRLALRGQQHGARQGVSDPTDRHA
jgi:B12-binding domain/radical SAM domain protein